MPSRATERINFGKIKEIIPPPNLIELQTQEDKESLKPEIPQYKRKNPAPQAMFTRGADGALRFIKQFMGRARAGVVVVTTRGDLKALDGEGLAAGTDISVNVIWVQLPDDHRGVRGGGRECTQGDHGED
mgnify:CR=1 FL=1